MIHTNILFHLPGEPLACRFDDQYQTEGAIYRSEPLGENSNYYRNKYDKTCTGIALDITRDTHASCARSTPFSKGFVEGVISYQILFEQTAGASFRSPVSRRVQLLSVHRHRPSYVCLFWQFSLGPCNRTIIQRKVLQVSPHPYEHRLGGIPSLLCRTSVVRRTLQIIRRAVRELASFESSALFSLCQHFGHFG